MAEESKGLSVTITIKQAVMIMQDDADFSSTLDDTVAQFRTELMALRTLSKSKVAVVDGTETLEQKGVGVTITYDF